MSVPDAKAKLTEAAQAFLQWRDSLPDDAGGLNALVGRAQAHLLLAEYVHALSRFAAECGAESGELEPARRMAIALHDSGSGFGNPLFRHEDALHTVAWKLWGGRKAPSRLWMEGRAVGCVRFLVDGGVPTARASAHVAKVFGLAGHKGRKGGTLSGRIVREWYDSLTCAAARDRDGWARVDGLADLERQNEALETVKRLLKRANSEDHFGAWFSEELFALAHSCATDPPSDFPLGADLTGS